MNHINSSSASPDSNESPIFVNRTPPLHKPISVPVVQSSSKTPDISNNNTPENIEDHASKENYVSNYFIQLDKNITLKS